MGRRFQSGHVITFPTAAILNGTDGGPRTVLVVGKANTSAYQPIIYTRSSGAHGWWMEIDTTGGLHVNYGTGTTARNTGTVTTSAAAIWCCTKDNGGTFHPFGRNFTGASFATDSGDIDSGSTLIDGTAIDTSWGTAIGRWGNTGSDYAADLEVYFIAVWNSILTGATLAGLTKTKAGILAGSPDYYISFEGTTATDSAGATPTITGTTTVSDPSGFFGSGGLTQALPVATETSSAITLGRRKTRAVPVASTTESAQTPGARKSRTVPVASQATTALAPVASKRRTVPVATDTSTAQTLAGKKTRALPQASETATAQVIGPRKSRALPVASDTSTAQAIVGSKRRTVPVAATADEALALGGRKTRALPAALESSTARTLAGRKSAPLTPAVETSTAVTFTTPEGGLIQALPVAGYIETARTIVGSKRQELPPAYEYSTAVPLAGGTPEGSGVMVLGDIMDEMAARLRLAPTLAGRTYAYPPGSIKAPAAIVTYPTNYRFDQTYGRGMDRITGEVVIVVGRPTERQSRDRLTKYADGAGPESVKALLDGDAGDYASCDSVTVTEALFDVVSIGGTDYLAAVFSVDIAGRGALS